MSRATVMVKSGCALVLLVLLTPSALAKGSIVEIEIIGDGIDTPLAITDAGIVSTFSIWNGPSVTTYTKGIRNPPTHLDPTVQDGRFIDWPKGIAAQRPRGLRRFEVTFHIDSRRAMREYIVAYEMDPASGQGYIYLPKWTNDLIWHGVEGSWLYASERFDDLIMPLVVQHMASDSREEGNFRCTLGTGRIAHDGTVTLERAGGRTRFRYSPSDSEYRGVMAHIGALAPGAEKEVSCWPPRS